MRLQILRHDLLRANAEVGIEGLVERRVYILNAHFACTVLKKLRSLCLHCAEEPTQGTEQRCQISRSISILCNTTLLPGSCRRIRWPPTSGATSPGSISVSKQAGMPECWCREKFRCTESYSRSVAPRATPGLLARELLPVCGTDSYSRSVAPRATPGLLHRELLPVCSWHSGIPA